MRLSLTWAVQAAVELADSVSPGRVQRTVFSGEDVAPFIGLAGASFIARLPDDAPVNANPNVGFRWFVNGDPTAAPDYTRYERAARCSIDAAEVSSMSGT